MEPFFNQFLQKFLEFAIPVIAVGVFVCLLAIARYYWGKFRAWKPNLAYALEEAAAMAVKAAEQAGAAGFIQDKKAYALSVIEKQLLHEGIKLDLYVIDAAAEAAVYDYINKDKVAAAGKVCFPGTECPPDCECNKE